MIHPEGPRYAAPLVFVPGLWMRGAAYTRIASFFAHRGWTGHVAEPADQGDSVDERARGVAALCQGLQGPPVLVGSDAAGLVALAVARRCPVAGVVWLAPMGPGTRAVTAAVGVWSLAWALLRGAPVAQPAGRRAVPILGDATAEDLCAIEGEKLVRAVARPGASPEPPPCPAALVFGESDAIGAGVHLAGAERIQIDGAGRWLLGGAAWQPAVARIHRWLITRLGHENLEIYDEVMAERDAE